MVGFKTRTVDGENRRGFCQPIDLVELPAEFGFHSFDCLRRRRCTCNNHSNLVSSWHSRIKLMGCVDYCVRNRWRTTQQGNSVFVYTAQNLCPINFAQHHMRSAHCGHCVHHAPTIAMKLRQRVQVHIAVVYSHVPTKRCGVQPQIAMRKLHTFRTSRCATGVVNCCRGIFIGRPRFGLCRIVVQQLVAFGPNDETMLSRNVFQRIFKLGVNDEHLCTTMLDDVSNLFSREPKVDWCKHSTICTDSKEAGEQPSRVLADNGDASTLSNTQLV